MRKNLYLLLALFWMNAAIARNSIGDVQLLLEAGEYQAAYAQAQELLDENIGEPGFDVLYGRLAYENAEYHHAIFAFERVVRQPPENAAAALRGEAYYWMARSYESLGRLDSTVSYLQEARPLSSAERQSDIDARLSFLTRSVNQQSTLVYVELKAGHDSNVNRAAGQDVIQPPLSPPITVGAGGKQQSDLYRGLSLGAIHQIPLASDWLLELRGSVAEKDFFSDDDYDELMFKAEAIAIQQLSTGKFQLKASAQNIRLSGSSYVNSKMISALFSRPDTLGDWYAGASYGLFDYPGNGLLNIDQATLFAGMKWQVGQYRHGPGVSWLTEWADDSQGKHNAREGHYVFYDLDYTLDQKNRFEAKLSWGELAHKDSDPVFSRDRDNTLVNLSGSWFWRYDSKTIMSSKVAYTDHDSDITYYEYDRYLLELGVRRAF